MQRDAYDATREDRFTFGLWTVGNRGADPFGAPVRPELAPARMVEELSKLQVWGVNLHDNDLVPFEASGKDRDRIVKDFRKSLKDNQMEVGFVSTNLFSHPIFKEGAFTATEPKIRAFAIQKAMRAIDLGAELGARFYIQWGGREGSESNAAKHPVDAIKRFREALDFLCAYIKDQGYSMRVCLEPKPNEPRGDLFLPSTGHMLAFIDTLEHAEMVGVNPEVAHAYMAGLNYYHELAQAMEAGKLFHVDLNDQKFTRFDQDLRFGSENPGKLLWAVKLLDEGGYDGPLCFDAHAYRTSSVEGVWEFARGCMRNYKILREKARRLSEIPEIDELLSRNRRLMAEEFGKYSRQTADKLKSDKFDIEKLADTFYPNERIDQLVTEYMLGVRQPVSV